MDDQNTSSIKSAISVEIAAAKQSGRTAVECGLRVNLAEALWIENKFTESVMQYNAALGLAHSLGDDDKAGMIYAGKAFALLHVGEHIDAVVRCYEKSLAIADRLGNPTQVAFVKGMIANARSQWQRR